MIADDIRKLAVHRDYRSELVKLHDYRLTLYNTVVCKGGSTFLKLIVCPHPVFFLSKA